jgi:hypothetical protein
MKVRKEKYTVAEGVYSQTIGDETVLLDMNGEEYFGLNHVGTIIWKLLQESRDLQYIHNELLETFDSDSETIAADLMELVALLLEKNLITVED